MQRRGLELRLVLQGASAPTPKPDALLLQTLIEGRVRVADYLDPDHGITVSAIARRDRADVGDVSRSLQLAFLAPGFGRAHSGRTQLTALTAERLKRAGELPLLWEEQRRLLS